MIRFLLAIRDHELKYRVEESKEERTEDLCTKSVSSLASHFLEPSSTEEHVVKFISFTKMVFVKPRVEFCLIYRRIFSI
jgi:hypothetical protein